MKGYLGLRCSGLWQWVKPTVRGTDLKALESNLEGRRSETGKISPFAGLHSTGSGFGGVTPVSE
jgi:hypothetical protein